MNEKSWVFLCVFIATIYSSKAQNHALDFNGSNQYGQVPHNDALKPNQFTVEAWVRADAANGSYQTIVSGAGNYNNSRNAYGYILYNYNNRWVLAYGNQAEFRYLTSNTPVQVGVWTHVAATYNGSQFRLYVNGNLDRNVNDGFSPDKPNGTTLYIGADYTSTGDYFDGLIDYVRIWNTALTEQQIRNNISRSIPPNENNLVANYEFNEGSGSSFANRSTNVSGLNGTLVNGPTWVNFPRKTLHLKTDAGLSNSGTNVTGWQDQAGINNFTITGTAGYVSNGINFHPTVSFNNTNSITTIPSNRLEGDKRIAYTEGLAVYKHTNANSTFLGSVTRVGNSYGVNIFGSFGANSVWVGSGDGGNYSHYTAPGLTNSFVLSDINIFPSSPHIQGRTNGTSYTVTDNGSDFREISFTPMIGGTNNDNNSGGWPHAVGEVAEMILFSSYLSSAERSIQESYLAIKYGIHLNSNYVNSNSSVIWNSSANSQYHHDVFGIGRDNTTGLNQASSNSVNTGGGNGTGQSGKGNLVIQNPSSLDNNDFLLIGHNNSGLVEQNTDLPASLSGNKRIAREWKVGKINEVGTVRLSFSTLGLSVTGTSANDFKLLIDTDGNGNFADGTVTVLDATSYSVNVLTFDAVTLPQGAVFTFITDSSRGPGPGIPGASLWLKANAGVSPSTGTLATWTDQTSNHATSIAGDPQVTSQLANFNPTIVFDGVDDRVFIPHNSSLNTPAFTLSTVVSSSQFNSGNIINSLDLSNFFSPAGYALEIGSEQWQFIVGNGTSLTSISGGPVNLNEWKLLTAKFEGTTASFYVDGRLAGTASIARFSQNTQRNFKIAHTETNLLNPISFFAGDLAEISYFGNALTTNDQVKHESYLALKYGITLDPSVTNYTSSAGTVLWNNTTYWHDVFGIGKDDASSLEQTQSSSINTGSGDGTGQSGKGNIVLSNPSSLDNNDFLLIGHDNGAFTEQTTDLPASLIGFRRIGREWKVRHTGNVGTVTLKFSTLGLTLSGTTAADFKLLIDADGNGDFTNGTVTEVTPSSFTGDELTFNAVNLPNGAVFTLLTPKPQAGPGVLGANLWLKANEGVTNSGANLAGWVDQTGTNTFTISGNPQTGASKINFNNAIDFDGNGDYLTGNSPITFQTLYAVSKLGTSGQLTLISSTLSSDGSATNRGYMAKGPNLRTGNNQGIYFNSTGDLGTSLARLSVVELVAGQLPANHKTYIDGTFHATTLLAGSNAAMNPFSAIPYIGRSTDPNEQDLYNGQIAEIIMYSTPHSELERNKIQSYLAIKYGITLDPSVTSYVNSSGNTIWDNQTYWHDVFGIGKDEASTLNQTRSNSINTGSGDGIGQTGKGNIIISNPSSLDDRDFLIIGHNNDDLTTQTTDLPANLGVLRVKREWKVQRTGDPGTVNLSFDLNGLTFNGSKAEDFKLVVDTDGNGDFTDGNPNIVNSTSFSGNIISFDGINLPNEAVFTFVTGPGDASWTLTKQASPTTFDAIGVGLGYQFTATNTGNVSISGVSISDPLIPNLSQTPIRGTDIGNDGILSPGEAWRYVGAYITTQADLDRGFVENTATISGTPAGGNLQDAVSNTVRVTAVPNPSWTLTKRSSSTSFSTTGFGLPYEFIATNTGNVSISGISINDPLIPNLLQTPIQGTDIGNDGILSPGEAWRYVGDYTTTQADLDRGFVENTATISGTPSGGTLGDARSNTVITNAIQNPSWTLNKIAATPSFNSAGSPIIYKFVLTNTGNVPITNVRLIDITINREPGINQATDIGDDQILSPGEVWEYVTSYRTTQADLDAGFFTNIARATGNSVAGALTPASDTVTVNAIQSPAWTLTKSTTATGYSQVGDVIPYEFQLSNIGNVSISNVSLADNLLLSPPVLVSGDGGNKSVLEVGETWVYQGSYTVTQADLDAGIITNTASASGTPSGGNLADISDSITISAVQNAAIDFIKIVASIPATYGAVGDTIVYQMGLQNTGNVTISNVKVEDPTVTSGPTLSSGDTNSNGLLDVGESWTYNAIYIVNQDDIDAGSVTNVATASGTPSGGTLNDVTSSVTVVGQQAIALDLDKTVSTNSFINAGEIVTYTFTVTNNGNVTLKEVILSDARINFNQSIGILAPGETQTFTSDYTITQADVNSQIVINTATVSGKSPSDVVVDATASAYVAGQDQGALEVIKKVKEKTYSQAGETLNYDILVRNVGNITVNTIQVTDNLTGFSTTIPSLAPGVSTTLATSYAVTQPDVDAGKVVNEVNVSGVEASPQATVLTAKDIEVSTANISPSINVQTSLQSGPNPYSALGEILTFETVVTNTGNVTLSNVTISEPLSGITIPALTSLAPGTSQSFTFTYTIKQSDLDAGSVTNFVSVSGTSPSNVQVTSQASITILSRQNNGILLTKSGNPATYSQIGEEITYSLEVRNTGNVSLSNVTITDPLTGLNQNLGPIISGVSIPVTATYRITQQDLDRGFVSNTARVSATDPSNQSISTTAIDTVRAVQNPQLTLQKTADKSSYSTLGEPITYTLTISNPGNVTLKNLLVSDPLTGVNSNLGTLSPGDTKTVKTTHLVTQQDLDAGDLTNTAIVDAVDPNAVTIEVTDALTINAVQNPGIEIVKTALTSTYVAVNDLLEYEIKVTNTGNVTLSSVTVEDPLTQTNQNVGTLIPGASQTITVSYFVTQADLDNGSIINTATVSATDPSSNTVQDQSSVTVQGTSSPSLNFTKAADKINVQAVGEIITYSLEVTNTGNVTLSDLVVEDNLTGFVSSPPFTLAPNASQSFTTTYTVNQADLDLGYIENIARVGGQDPFNLAIDGADTLNIQALQGPALELEKTVSQTTFKAAGEVVTYTFVVTNIGNVTLTGVVLDDPRVSFNQAVGTLAPGASQTFSFDYTLSQADVDGQVVINTATVTGIAPDSSIVSVNDVAYVTIEDLGALDINKVALNKSYSSVGEQVDFEITVSNIGNVTIDNVRVIDALTGLDSNIGNLQPGANVVVPTSYVITQADIDAGKIVNLATVEGVENTPQARPVSAKDEATAFAIRNGAVKIEKVTSTPTYDVSGFTLRYELLVTNTGNVTLTNVRVTDPLTKLDQIIPSLSPGQAVNIPTTYLATLTDMNISEITNLAYVSATTPGSLTVSDKDAVRSQAVQRPALSLAKTANVSDYDQVGDLITYTIEATNSGNVTLFNLVVSDPLTGTNQNIGNLDPGQSFSITEIYQITQADLDAGSVVNTAEVAGLDSNSNSISATASATVPAIQNGKIEFTKTGSPNSYDQVGDIITYRLTVKNTGNVTLRNLVITDPLTGFNQTFATLPPQSSQVINETYAVAQSDIDGGFILNTANVQAFDPANQKLVASDTYVIGAQQNPGIALTKVTTTPTYSQVGDILSFTLEISNTGNETLTDVTVKDPLTNLDQNLGTISPGQSQTLVTTYTITQADLDAGQVTNTASVSGLDPNSQSLVASAASIANAIQSPALSLTKTSQSNTYSQNGELITFDLRVENTGNVTLQNVLVKDPLTGLNQNVGTLSPGQSTSVSTSYRITQKDLDKGQFINTGIVEGTDPLGNTIRVSESETITAQLNPEIEITKSAIPTTYDQVGDVIRYVLKIRNTGNVTMNSIRVTDPLTGLDRNLGILVPKKVLTLNESYTITQLDIDRGEVINTAFVSAKSPDKTDYQDSSRVIVTAIQNPGLGLTKTTATPFYSNVGDVLNFDLVVKNTGNETLFKVRLQDPLTGLVQSLGTMNPGDSISVSTSYTVTQADVDGGQVDNSASVLGLDPKNKKVSASASSVAIASQAPSIDIKKTATPTTFDQIGDIITYQLEISNTGNLTLSDVVVVDPLTNTNQAIGTLTPGQKITVTEAYQIKQSDIDNGSVINTASVTALDPNGLDVSDNASATATAVQNPGIGIIKSTVTPGNYSQPGDEIEFTIIVSNTGNETLTDVTVVDLLTNLNQVVGTLLPGETQTITTSYFVSQADIDAGKVINTATVSGTDPNSFILTSSAVSLASAIQSSSISIVKTADKNDFNQLGEIITYSFELTNTGNTTLSNIVLSDPLINLTESVQPLSPGASYTTLGTYTVKQSDLDQGFIRNVASLSAEDPTNSILRDADTLLINAVQNPALTLIKTASAQSYSSVGEDITYDLTVTNSGNVTLTDLNLVDPLTGLNQDLGDFIPGESISIQSNYVITQGDLDAGEVKNTATVSGLDPGSQEVSDSDTVVMNAVQNPDLLFEKIAIPRIFDQAGDQITYTLTITNTGNLTLNSLQLTDPLTATDSSIGSIAPGQAKTLTVVYQTSQQDVDSGEVLNTATITGLDPFGNSITRIDTALVTAIQNPGIGLIKVSDKKEYSQVGEVLTYTLTAVNTGNETLTDVTITDPLTGLTQNVGSLSPGESQSVTTSYTVTQQDLDSGRVLNTGTASGTDPNQTVVSADAQAVSNAVQTPGLG
ncbi:DUF7507 domain-containing protein, partial [Algoriphagus marincola]|uniref:DUF7507 domain-containing protein n=1 Tax=Algoriphagus marincola TaxID=264027 RepID=UPI00138AD955